MVTANGEVQTNEEAQVFVHDLNLFVTVQVLDETPAVLSQGKLCEDHGYSNEWVSGQKPRLTKDGKTVICKTDNFVPLVVPGLSTNPKSSSSSASLSQNSLRKEAETATRQLVPPASSTELQHAQRLELENAHHGYVESRQEEQVMKEKAIRDTQMRSMHEMGEMKRAQELRVCEFSVQKLTEKVVTRYTGSLHKYKNYKNR